jgi:Na+/proline symporter
MIAAALLVVASVLFTFVGGLKSVLWNDLIQFCVYLGSAIAVLVFLRYAIPAPTARSSRADAHARGRQQAAAVRFVALALASLFHAGVVLGMTLLYIANAGMDQDTTQRLLSCADAKTSARGLYMSVLARCRWWGCLS